MQIGIVAKRIGLSVDAIRFYERNGLLPRAQRTEGGFRRYGENDVETVAFVRRVQGLGFNLSEIRGPAAAGGSFAALCAGAASPASEASRRTTEIGKPPQTGARTAFGSA